MTKEDTPTQKWTKGTKGKTGKRTREDRDEEENERLKILFRWTLEMEKVLS